ncbi:MAG: DNA-binding transcriptional regulator [Planctomycetia bacterium]|nr:DNA-binding transcriptional regulator [Planctomycetia bacterium]
MSETRNKRRVAVLMESTRAYSRAVIRGIGQYNRQRGQWVIEYTPRGQSDPPPVWLKHWEGDGILARINDARLLDAIRDKGLPTIDLRRILENPDIPQFGPNDRMIAQLLFDHFRQRGFYSFAFLGYRDTIHLPMMHRRLQAVQELVQEAGMPLSVLKVGTNQNRDRFDAAVLLRLRMWLEQLPSQTAIIACNDDMAFYVLRECRQAGIAVPEQLAVAGIGNDECFCSLCNPTLTSVDLNAETVGFEAAATLEKMMDDSQYRPDQFALIPPRGIVTRQSTDVIATADERVARAVCFIREQASTGITPRDVLRHVRLSRVALENRFKQTLGRTIHQEIIRVRIDRVRELLTTSELSFKEIAHETGFAYAEYMMRVFRNETGQTLKNYRRDNKKFGS